MIKQIETDTLIEYLLDIENKHLTQETITTFSLEDDIIICKLYFMNELEVNFIKSYNTLAQLKQAIIIELNTRKIPVLMFYQLIQQLEKIKNKTLGVMFNFPKATPNLTEIAPYLGDYYHIAIGYKFSYDVVSCENFLNTLKRLKGTHLTAYRGGEYLVSEYSLVYCDNWGDCNNFGIVNVIETRDNVILEIQKVNNI